MHFEQPLKFLDLICLLLQRQRHPQFWIEQKRLLFVRSLKPGRAGTMQEVQFNKYEPIKGGWVAPEVVFTMNGQRMLYEEYFNIQVPATLDPAIFNPATFLEATW